MVSSNNNTNNPQHQYKMALLSAWCLSHDTLEKKTGKPQQLHVDWNASFIFVAPHE
ncbi:hypothetical protein E2C01_062133 [Portunus trituberculatus]|uniref:Uncharacterized protein n=1 Tax=Portunus trituberculatus TaxID=210409 RepID=A0A5B7HD81_PORTR|nr:hypothetical protein [Portunus trituberculatus]